MDHDEDIWIITERNGGARGDQVRQLGDVGKMNASQLGLLLNRFAGPMQKALGQLTRPNDDWEVEEVAVTVTLLPDKGFTLVDESGVGGILKLTFARRTPRTT